MFQLHNVLCNPHLITRCLLFTLCFAMWHMLLWHDDDELWHGLSPYSGPAVASCLQPVPISSSVDDALIDLNGVACKQKNITTGHIKNNTFQGKPWQTSKKFQKNQPFESPRQHSKRFMCNVFLNCFGATQLVDFSVLELLFLIISQPLPIIIVNWI